jgi:ubiquinone biosynthesis protein UbiJ
MNTLPTLVCASLEAAVNRVLRLDPDTLDRLSTLSGKVIAVELHGLNTALYLVPEKAGLNVFSHFDGAPDTTLRGTPLALARMGLEKHAGDSLFAGDVEIAGDTELGQEFRAILDGLDIDWEEQLSMVMGDAVAHQVGQFVRGAAGWGKKTLETLSRDAAEYLQEESRELPNSGEAETFLTDVDELRSDVDRIEARVKRLESRKEVKE